MNGPNGQCVATCVAMASRHDVEFAHRAVSVMNLSMSKFHAQTGQIVPRKVNKP
jgi:hypothetical protein